MLQKQLAETDKGIENIVNAIQHGIITSSTKNRLDELEANKAKLEISIAQEEIQKPTITKMQVTFFLHKFGAMDATNQEQKQKLGDTFINAIYLYDDKIVFTFNYNDCTKTINLDDLKCSFGSDLSVEGAPPAKC